MAETLSVVLNVKSTAIYVLGMSMSKGVSRSTQGSAAIVDQAVLNVAKG